MKRVTLRGMLGRKLRTALTAFAIVLGVAMVSGSLVLTDTIQKAFDAVFTSSYENTDAVVTGVKLVDWSQTGRVSVSPQLLREIRALPEVKRAAGTILDISGDGNQAKILDKQGRAIDNGNPTFGLGVDPADEQFNPFVLVAGTWASGPAEVVIDRGTASSEGFRVGETIEIAGEGPVRRYRVTGIATFGDVNSLGGATFAVFDVKTAQAVLRKDGFDAIGVAAADGVSVNELLGTIGGVLPTTATVRSGTEQAREDAQGVASFVSFIRWLLVGFGGVALFVGAFVIFNTLSITVAQRTRELATLRTLGASRRQVLRSVVLEGLVLGVVASVVGLLLGVGLAAGLTKLLAALDLDLPRSDMVFAARTAVVALLAGTSITLAASVIPAIRATRIQPIAAVREGASTVKALTSRGLVLAALVLALSLAALGYGMLGDGIAVGVRVAGIATGSLGVFVGTALLAPRLVRPLASVVGWPGARLGGAAGRLARDNALRNPARTASTAAALMIGLALVTFVAVLGRALVASDETAIRSQLATSHVVTSQSGWDTVPVGAGRSATHATGVELVSSVRGDRGLVFGAGSVDVSGVDPATIGRAYRFSWRRGSEAALGRLGRTGVIVRRDLADGESLRIGDPLYLQAPSGKEVTLVVAGVYEPAKLDSLLGHVVVSHELFDRTFPRAADLLTFADASSQAALERSLAAYPDAKVLTQDAFVEERTAWLSSMMNLFYVLLALSVVVSLFGMVNTLVLSVFERTREIGMLRAVGMTRRQTRRMVRHEAIVTSLIGATLGIALGVGLTALTTQALGKYGVSFSLPAGSLVAFATVAIVAGVIAAILPARRAARLDVLHALHAE